MKKLARSLVIAGVVASMTLVAVNPSQAADTCTPITTELKAPKLGKLYAYAIDLTTNRVLVKVRSNEQTPSASVMKTITNAAAIKYIVKPREVAGLAPYVATTSVLTNPAEPGTLILRGGGDHTLSRVKQGSYTTYFSPGQHPAKMRELAAAALAALPAGTVINKIVLDDTFFKGPSWNPNHFDYSRTSGDISPITGLMIDAARMNPDLTDTSYSGKRVKDPTVQAGQNFKTWLQTADDAAALQANDPSVKKLAANVSVFKGKTPANAVLLTSKDSQPITNWIRHALKISDNTETEVIARHTELAMGLKNNFASVQQMGRKLFRSLGVNPKLLVMKDASGLAPNNRVTAQLLVALLKSAADPNSDIASLPSYMATSGDGGTLGGRFVAYNKTTKRNELVIPNGAIRAKTGFISGVYGLAGLVTTAGLEPHTIAFAIFARNDSAHGKLVGAGTKDAIDAVVEKLYLCGPTL
jgi:D-alanyl-D-alanine carboxypeptidase/D-alanyl-D-alanine-endopeptidase (penicillin-binding protein 4)